MKNITRFVLLLSIAIGFANLVKAESEWPKEIPLDNGGKIIIYQPQPESLNGNMLSARAAVSISPSAGAEETFGSIWFDAFLQTDKDNRVGTLESLNIKEAKFPGIKDDQQLQQYTSTVQNVVPQWNMQFSLDQLLTSIQQTKQLSEPNLKNDAPNIIYRDRATTLIVLDGLPRLQLDKESGMQRVVNTPSTIVLNPDDNLYYFYGGGLWYSSSNILNGWSYVSNVPYRIQQFDLKIQQKQSKDADSNNQDKPTTPTDIIVSTQPAELIQTDGTPSYQTIEGTSLLFVDNTLNDIFKDINSQQNYILISGRWYTSTSLTGGWSYVSASQLPADFAKIPEGSEKDGILSSVAGTNAANEALMDAQIPQTAKVDRQTATTTVTYDGEPIFKPIRGTNLMVAENSSVTVLKSNTNEEYYAVDNGVWFKSDYPNGPWQVSTERPSDVDNIPADNIAYNTKYVYVYDYTPDYVYTGYTPGYLGCYVYGPTVVWGTGWYYHPWYRHNYYPRPYTWGFGMAYNPWTGWSIGYQSGYSLGWHYYDHNSYSHGWFGPRVYHPAYRPWGYNGGFYGRDNVILRQPRVVVNRPVYVTVNNNRNNYYSTRNVMVDRNHNINLYNHVKGASTIDVNRTQGVITVGNRGLHTVGNNQYQPINRPQNNNGINNGFGNRPAIIPNPQSNGTINRPAVGNLNNNGFNQPIVTPRQGNERLNNSSRPFATPSTQPNNVATDRQGNIYKFENNGAIQQRQNNTWKPAPQTQAPQEVNNVQQQRERSNTRDMNFQRSAPQVQQRYQPASQQPSVPRGNSNGNENRRYKN